MMSAKIEESIQCPVCCPRGLRVTKAKQCRAAVTGAETGHAVLTSHITISHRKISDLDGKIFVWLRPSGPGLQLSREQRTRK